MAEKLPKAVRKVLGIASPSRVFAEIGRYIPEGLALGIERNLGSVDSAMDAMRDATSFTVADAPKLRSSLQEELSLITSRQFAELGEMLQNGMADALEGVSVKLNSREFGRFTRQAVKWTI